METDQKPKISTTTFWFMIAVSIFFDVLLLVTDVIDLIPVVGTGIGIFISILIDIFAGLTFYVWFKTKGVSFSGWKRIASFWGGFVLSWIPFANIFAWTLDVWLVNMTLRAEGVLEKVAPGAAKVVNRKVGGPKLAGPPPLPRTIVPERFPRTPNTNTGDIRESSNTIVRPSVNNRPQQMQDIRTPGDSEEEAA